MVEYPGTCRDSTTGLKSSERTESCQLKPPVSVLYAENCLPSDGEIRFHYFHSHHLKRDWIPGIQIASLYGSQALNNAGLQAQAARFSVVPTNGVAPAPATAGGAQAAGGNTPAGSEPGSSRSRSKASGAGTT